ncbi:MAG: DUF58 domain-containing protein [Opitutales bacterium]|nr:DUF58 domain-containing protein [Opitutales bacterium]
MKPTMRKAGDYIDQKAISKLVGTPQVSTQAMMGTISGYHRSSHKGSSVEFAEYREYSPGDDLKRLDWRVLGRTERFYLKEFEADTNLQCHFLLDSSASMNFGNQISKFEYGKKLVGTLSYLFLQQGDAVGMDLSSINSSITSSAKRNPAQMNTILQALLQAKAEGDQSISSSIHRLAQSSRKRSLIIVISDFFEEADDIKQGIHHCRDRKHQLLLFHLLDKQEENFNFTRPTRFIDLENGNSLISDPQSVRDEYLDKLKSHIYTIEQGCLETQSSYHKLSTHLTLSDGLKPFATDPNFSRKK